MNETCDRCGPGVRAAVVAGGFAILSVATSRVYLGAHWATDTAAGILVGLFWVVVFAFGTEFFDRRRKRPRPAAGTS